MTRHCGELFLVDHDNDVLNWSTNEKPLPMRNQKKCKSSRCFHLGNSTIAICSFLVLFSVVSLTIYFGLRQHMNGKCLFLDDLLVFLSTNSSTWKQRKMTFYVIVRVNTIRKAMMKVVGEKMNIQPRTCSSSTPA